VARILSAEELATEAAVPAERIDWLDALFGGGPDERYEFGVDLIIRGLETYARPPGEPPSG
jgi:hypothetical protein